MFRRRISFKSVDPLANGLDDEIAAERSERDSFANLTEVSADDLNHFWSGVIEDIHKDPTWFDFSED